MRAVMTSVQEGSDISGGKRLSKKARIVRGICTGVETLSRTFDFCAIKSEKKNTEAIISKANKLPMVTITVESCDGDCILNGRNICIAFPSLT